MEFNKLKISDIQRETADCVVITLEIPEHHRQRYRYLPGQHLVFRYLHDGQEIRRTYSICSGGGEKTLMVASKKIRNGIFSTFVNEKLNVGDELEVSLPQGSFTLTLDASHQKTYLAIAAGSGITPVIALIKAILHREPLSRVILVYGNRTPASIIFKGELDALKNHFMDRFSLYHMMSRELTDVPFLQGRITAEKIDLLTRYFVPLQTIDEALLCGPEEMIFTIKEFLQQKGMAQNKIHFELFFSEQGAVKRAEREVAMQSEAAQDQSEITLLIDGKTMFFTLARQGTSILEAALQRGADLPYACKGGVCATCKCMLESGEVEMDVNYSLEPDELARGYVLACQSHPLTEKVTLNFDRK